MVNDSWRKARLSLIDDELRHHGAQCPKPRHPISAPLRSVTSVLLVRPKTHIEPNQILAKITTKIPGGSVFKDTREPALAVQGHKFSPLLG